MSSDGTADVVGVFPAPPTYKELENAVREVSLNLDIALIFIGLPQ